MTSQPVSAFAPANVSSARMSLPTRVSAQVEREIQHFYYWEARLQHLGEHRAWLETLVDREVHYWMPVFEVRFRKDRRPGPTPDDPAIYNDGYDDLDHRIRRLESGMVWMEDPPTRIRFFVTNIEAFEADSPNCYQVFSNVHVYRNRRQREETITVGGREDVLRRAADGQLRIYRRKIVLDQRVVLDKNLNFFM